MTDKKCLACDKPIQGRSDKKFCNDSCRNNYNNRLNSDTLPAMRNINNILRKNRRILEELLTNSNKKVLVVERKKLIEKGFHFEYFTEQNKSDKKKEYYYCYDYGYRTVGNDRVAAVKDTRKSKKLFGN